MKGLILAVSLALTACSGPGAVSPVAPAVSTPNVAPTAVAAATATTAAAPTAITSGAVAAKATTPTISRPLEGSLPRSVTYGGLQFNLTKGVITNQDPYGTVVNDHVFAYLDFSIQNAQGESSLIDPGLARLQLSSGQFYADASAESVSVPAQASATMKSTFQLPPDSTWDNAKLVLGRAEKEPAIVPLTGANPTSPYPVKLAATGQATTKSYTYKLTGGTVDLDYKLQRVAKGMRYLRLTTTVTRNGDKNDWGGKTVMAENFRLVLAGQSIAPLVAPNEPIDLNSSVPAEVVFVVPSTTTHAELQVNEDGDSATMKAVPFDLALPS